MADVYREKVQNLCGASEREDGRTGAVEAIRALVEAILLEPDGGQLKITLKGDLAWMLRAARDSKRSPDTGDLLVQIRATIDLTDQVGGRMLRRMDTTTLLIIVVVILLLGGGGFFYRRR